MKKFIKNLLNEEYQKVVLLEELSLIIENEIYVGPALTKKLSSIDKPYANKLLDFLKSNAIADKAKIDSIEYGKDDNKTLTAYVKDRSGEFRGRKYKVGKLLTYLGVKLGDYKGYELEDLISHLKRDTNNEKDNFKVVDGDKILWAYHCDNYDEGETMGSCMRFASAQSYLEIYTANPNQVKCLVLLNPSNGKVRGRALLWNMDDGKTFMDRVYLINNEYKNLFLQYAEQHGYTQSASGEVNLDDSEFNEYPYMDTFQHLNKSKGILMKDSDGDEETIRLDDTVGGTSESGEHIELGSHAGETANEDEVHYLSYETPDGYREGFAHQEDVFVYEGTVYLDEDGIKLYDNSFAYKYDDDNFVVEIAYGPYEGDYALWDDCYHLNPDHYGEDQYVLSRGSDAVQLYDDHYDYTYALEDDAVKLYEPQYNDFYGFKGDAVRLFDKKYGENEYALNDDTTEIKLKSIGEVWVMDDDLDEFDSLRVESGKKLINKLVRERLRINKK